MSLAHAARARDKIRFVLVIRGSWEPDRAKEKLLVFFFSNLKSGENDGTCQELFDSEN